VSNEDNLIQVPDGDSDLIMEAVASDLLDPTETVSEQVEVTHTDVETKVEAEAET